ncbi:MAG: hypothetical protein HY242_01725 [Afipia sp.]|nr:hypothetical protein [Afipia sp.]
MSGKTDFWSNTFHIDGLDDTNHLLHVAKGNFPTHLILTFLHELSHAWLFSSPFGDAIAALRFRLQSAPERATLDELTKLLYALEFYRPIVEGHGLFSEYYSGIGEEDELTPVTKIILQGLAADREVLPNSIRTPEHLFSLYNSRNNLRRTSFSSVDKLRSLYNHSGEYPGIYLFGFHAVRSLYYLLMDGGALRSPDTFLMLMYEVFFKDKTIISKLLDSSIGSEEFRTFITDHLSQKVLPYLVGSGVELISQCRQLWSSSSSRDIYYVAPNVSYSIDVDLENVIENFVEETRRSTGVPQKWIDYDRLQRQYSVLVRRPVMLQTFDETIFAASFTDVANQQPLPIHSCFGRLKDGPAEFIVLISVLSSLWISFVGQGPDRIGIYHVHGQLGREVDHLIHREELAFLRSAYETLLACDDIVLPELNANNINLGHDMWHGIDPEKISKDARFFWFYWCNPLPVLSTDWSLGDDKRFVRAFDDIERNGLFPPTDTGNLAARTLAILSAAYGHGDNSKVAKDMMEEHGIDQQAGLDAIIQRSEELQLPILAARRTVEGTLLMSCFF